MGPGSERKTGFLRSEGKPIALVVDPDPAFIESFDLYNHLHLYFITASNGEIALTAFRRVNPDIVILSDEIDLKPADFRCEIPAKPVIITTNKQDLEHDDSVGVSAFEELKADNIVRKPVSSRLIEGYAMGILRTTIGSLEPFDQEDKITVGNLEMDFLRRVLKVDGEVVNLPEGRPWRVLEFFAKSIGRSFSRQQLLDEVWKKNSGVGLKSIDVHVAWLRKAIEQDPSKPEYIKTVPGGYKMVDPSFQSS